MNRQGGKETGLSYDQSLAKLFSGEVSEQEALAIRRNLESDASFHDDFTAAAGVISDMADLENDPDIQAIASQSDLKMPGKNHRYWSLLPAMAAVLIVAVGIGLFLQGRETAEKGSVHRYTTRIGEQKTVTLDDGSVMSLNTGTLVLVDMTETARRIILERGEAFFDVTGDPERPFTVDLGARSITVLGTEFNVLKLPDKYQIAVVEGVVAIHKNEELASINAPLLSAPEGESLRLNSLQQRQIAAGWLAEYHLDSGNLSAHIPKNMQSIHSWRTGLLEFYDEPLYKVVRKLNRYSAKKILIEDETVMGLNVYAGIDIKNLSATLIALEKILPIKVTTHYDRIVIVGSGVN